MDFYINWCSVFYNLHYKHLNFRENDPSSVRVLNVFHISVFYNDLSDIFYKCFIFDILNIYASLIFFIKDF